jgi:outer membrane protein TolC
MQLQQSIDALQVALLQPNPILQKSEQLDFVLGAQVPLLVPFAYPALQAAKRSEDAGRANYDVSDAQVLYSTAQAYYACAGADELVEARTHAVVVTQKALENARARLEAGVVNRVEVTRAELQLVRAQQALVESQDTQAQTYRALGTIMNMHDPVRVIATEAPLVGEAPVETLTAQALQLRPEFAALERTVDSNRLTASSNLWRWAPTVSAFGNVRAFNYAGFSGDRYSWAVGLQLDWTLYDGGIRDASRRLAIAQREENEAKLDLLKDQVRDDVDNAERALVTRRRALETARRSLRLSKETLDLVQVQHDAGTATQLDLLQAQDNLVAAEVALAQARFDLSLGGLQLERLSGAFPANLKLK